MARILDAPDDYVAARALNTLCLNWGLVARYRDVIVRWLTDPEFGLFDDRRSAAIIEAAHYLVAHEDREVASGLIWFALGRPPGSSEALGDPEFSGKATALDQVWAIDALAQAIGDTVIDVSTSTLRRKVRERYAAEVLERARQRWSDLDELVDA